MLEFALVFSLLNLNYVNTAPFYRDFFINFERSFVG